MLKKFFLLTMLAFAPLLVLSQVGKPGTPPSFSDSLEMPPLVFEQMPRVDVSRMLLEDQVFDTIADIPWRFGENVPLGFNPDNAGSWIELENGGRLWRLGMQSPGALSINLTFDHYRLPPDAELYVYSPDRSVVLGAFTDYNNQEDLYFATTLVPGEAVVVEYFEPAGVAFPGELNLQTLTHGYRSPLQYDKIFGRSGACNINVACPEAEGWADPVDAVVLVLVGSNSICSGAMINNTERDGRPFMLTASHCFFNPGSMVVWFNYQSETCENPSVPPPHDAMSGAVTRARYSPADVWLVELNQDVPTEYGPHFAGWNRTLESELNETIVSIHHPRGDIKKFSYALDGAQASAYLGSPGSGTNYWRVVWSGGTTTEPGSSGSPLFDARGRIIGQLHGGYAACGNTLPDWYSRFGVSWTGGGTESTALRYWLDPRGMDLQAIDGHRPFWTVTVGVSDPGYTFPPPGDYYVENGRAFSLSAQGGARWSFTHWDIDGQTYYEDEVSVIVNGDMTATAGFEFSRTGDEPLQDLFRVFPNPATSVIHLEAVGLEGGVVIELFDVAGQQLMVQREQAQGGDLFQVRVDFKGLTPGIYFLKISNGANIRVEKIMIGHPTRP
ncbi:MAG: T9SS type A sorting domain-containing protein [Bacteroidales bacterium]